MKYKIDQPRDVSADRFIMSKVIMNCQCKPATKGAQSPPISKLAP